MAFVPSMVDICPKFKKNIFKYFWIPACLYIGGYGSSFDENRIPFSQGLPVQNCPSGSSPVTIHINDYFTIISPWKRVYM